MSLPSKYVPKTSRVCRGDLLRALCTLGPIDDDANAARRSKLTGFELTESNDDESVDLDSIEREKEDEKAWGEAVERKQTPEEIEASIPPYEPKDTPFYACTRFEPGSDVIVTKNVTPYSTQEIRKPLDGVPPSLPDLMPWPRLWRRLRQALTHESRTSNLDLERFIGDVARGRPICRLPRGRQRRLNRRLTLVMDWSRRLVPFWSDEVRVMEKLRGLWGSSELDVRVIENGPLGPAIDPFEQRVIEEEIAPESNILVLGDLGYYGDLFLRRDWEEYGRRLLNNGHELCALAPVPGERLNSNVKRLWNVRVWDRVSPASRSPDDKENTLIKALSPLARIDPYLLRQERFRQQLNVAAEFDTWFHESCNSGSLVAANLSGDVAFEWLDHWRNMGDDHRKAFLSSLIELIRLDLNRVSTVSCAVGRGSTARGTAVLRLRWKTGDPRRRDHAYTRSRARYCSRRRAQRRL